jgi:dihydrofolate reductase
MFKVKMSTPNLTAIVAATKSNGIGLNGGLPWRLPGEMKYFAKGKSSSTGYRPLGRIIQW